VHRLEKVLEKVLEGQASSRQISEARLRLGLQAILGKELAAACTVVGVKGGTLVMATDNPALAHQLRLDSSQLLSRLNQESRPRRPLRALKVRVGRGPWL
jgi:hypothetical protein